MKTSPYEDLQLALTFFVLVQVSGKNRIVDLSGLLPLPEALSNPQGVCSLYGGVLNVFHLLWHPAGAVSGLKEALLLLQRLYRD